MKTVLLPFIGAATVFLIPGCRGGESEPVVQETIAMDTFVRATVYDHRGSEDEARQAIGAAFAEIRRVEASASDYTDSSEIGRVNLAAGRGSVEVSPELAGLLRTSLEYGRRSEGAFNIAIGPLVRAWNFLAEDPSVPPPAAIDSLLRLCRPEDIRLEGRQVRLARSGMRLDLGAIAKGHAADRAVAILRASGYRRVIVDIGGNLAVSWEGTNDVNSTAATIYVRHPRLEGAFFGRFRTGTSGISTSGDYQRSITLGGVRYHHILDPATGYPARNLVSVTVIASDATAADALSTLIFVLGRTRGMSFLRSLPGTEALLVYEEGGRLKYETTPGLRRRFTLEPPS